MSQSFRTIGMILDSPFPPDARVENEATHLIEKGYAVHLFCLCYKSSEAGIFVHNGIILHRYFINHEVFKKATALIHSFSWLDYLFQPLIKDFIWQLSPDVLHVHDMLLARVAIKIARRRKVPVVLDLHENRPEILPYYPHMQTKLGKLLVSIPRWRKEQVKLMQAADQVILVTEEAKVDAVSEGVPASKISVVPNTIRPDIFYQYPVDQSIIRRFDPSFIYLLYLGDTGLRRGTDTAIEALEILLKSELKVKLILVGRNREDQQLRQMVLEKGLTDHVYQEGWQDLSLFPTYLEVATVCLSLIKRNRHHDTTYANKIFQYMAAARPQVVSDCPPQRRVIEEARCGLVVPADDPQATALAIQCLLQNRKEAHQMGENGKKAIAETWQWKKKAGALTDLYRNLF